MKRYPGFWLDFLGAVSIFVTFAAAMMFCG